MGFQEFCRLISEITNVPIERIAKESSFRDDLGIDSLQFINLLVELTERFNVDVGAFQSLNDLKIVGSVYLVLAGEGKMES